MRTVLWRSVAAVAFLVPLVISETGNDRYRLPKELILRAGGIVSFTLIVLALLWTRWRPPSQKSDAVIVVLFLAVAWTAVATLFSSNVVISAFALLRVASLAVLFWITYTLAPEVSSRAVFVVIASALPNAVLLILQELQIWNPFRFEIELTAHEQSTALIGNPNDVGGYLVPVTLSAIAWIIASKKWRGPATAIAAILVTALLLNRTLTALVAFAIAGIILAWLAIRWKRRSLRPFIVGAGAIGLILLSLLLWSSRGHTLVEALKMRQYDTFLSGRLPAFAAAVEMIRDRPVVGVGPGCYGSQFYDHKLAAEEHYPIVRTSVTRNLNFGEAHNDHLQIAAETGVVGWFIAIAALVVIGHGSLSEPNADPRAIFAHLVSLPISVSLFALMLAGFPLQLAAPATTYAFIAALCTGWSAHA